MRRRGPEKIAGTTDAGLRAVQRLGQLWHAQRAAGHKQQRDQTTRVAFGAIVPDVVAGGHHLQTRARLGLPSGRDQRPHDRVPPPRALLPRRIQISGELDAVAARPSSTSSAASPSARSTAATSSGTTRSCGGNGHGSGTLRSTRSPLDQARARSVRRPRPGAARGHTPRAASCRRAGPVECTRGAGAGEYQGCVAEQVDQRLGADGEAMHAGTAAQSRQELQQRLACSRERARERSGSDRRAATWPRKAASPLASARTAQALLELSGWPTGALAMQAPLDAGQADAHAADADVVEGALLDQGVDARAADAETTGGLTRRDSLVVSWSERASVVRMRRNSRFGVHSSCGNGDTLAAV